MELGERQVKEHHRAHNWPRVLGSIQRHHIRRNFEVVVGRIKRVHTTANMHRVLNLEQELDLLSFTDNGDWLKHLNKFYEVLSKL